MSSDRQRSEQSLRPPQNQLPWYQPLTQRNYRLFLALVFTGSVGVWMQRLAQDWLVLQLTGSPAAVGAAVALQFLPMLVVGPLSGLLVDLFPKRRIMLVCQAVIALLAMGLAAWAASGTITVWAVYASCVALGVTSAINQPASQVFVNEVVGDAALRPAIGLNNAIGQLGAMAGPAVGGVVIAQAGSAAAFTANSLLCLLVLCLIAAIRPAELHPSTPAARGRGQLLAGFRYVKDRPSLLLIIALAGLLGMFGMNGPVVLAAFAERVWHNGVEGFGLFNTVSAIGALAGALLAARLRTLGRKGIVLAAGLFGLSQLVAALMPDLILFTVMLVVVGLMTLLFLTSAATAVQLEAGPEIRGRVMALYLPLLLGGHAIGGLLAGWLTEQFGVRLGLVATGALGMLSALVIGLLLWRNGRATRTSRSRRAP
ncbi:putative MFS family arabinose efflux permease [Arthrobacter sp. SLBN-100]|uniref:MFS transporter n=1 Tax=Arthrobacter sp. SLBN-100 TaxID=2768450 RepID=UPI001154C9CB|nr:MFS transporter [Arthrobacter sp. SLBN-100]TQJ67911.1 putative MFS family arabinose efflux permease [Arthrobacter sp. SLBN-100]